MQLIMWPNNLRVKGTPKLMMFPTMTMAIPSAVVYHVFTSRQAPLCRINSPQCLRSWLLRSYSVLVLEHQTLHADLDPEETLVHRLSHCGTTQLH